MAIKIKRKGMLLVLSGPAGAGKGTLGKMLLQNDKSFYFSVSATTRKPRFNETDGVDYHFLNCEDFCKLYDSGAFLETAVVHGHNYGTLRGPIEENIENGINVLLDIDTQGAMSVISKYPDCVSIFILPPSWEILEQRLHTRNTDEPQEIRKRLNNARTEVTEVDNYKYVIINDTVENAFENLDYIVRAEKQSTKRFIPTLLDNII